MKNNKQKFNYPKKSLIVFLVITGLLACSKTGDNSATNMTTASIDCSGASKSFSAAVNPIIQTFCATGSSCHGSASVNGPGELTTYSEILSAHAQIRSAVLSGIMPKNASLTAAQKNTIICWIDNGSSNN